MGGIETAVAGGVGIPVIGGVGIPVIGGTKTPVSLSGTLHHPAAFFPPPNLFQQVCCAGGVFQCPASMPPTTAAFQCPTTGRKTVMETIDWWDRAPPTTRPAPGTAATVDPHAVPRLRNRTGNWIGISKKQLPVLQLPEQLSRSAARCRQNAPSKSGNSFNSWQQIGYASTPSCALADHGLYLRRLT